MRPAIVLLALSLTACASQVAAEGGSDTTTTVYVEPHEPTTVKPDEQGKKIEICHQTGNGYVVIEINENALPAHLAHGDIPVVPPTGCPDGHPTTTDKPHHSTTTTDKPHETTTTTTHGGGGTTTTVKQTTTTTGGGGTTTTAVATTTTTTGGGGTTTTTGGGGSTTTVLTTTTTTSPPSGGTSTTTTTSTTPGGTTTTTTLPSTTTSTPDQVFVRAAGTTCDNEVPKIVITFGNLTQFDGVVGTLTMRDINGNVLSVQPLTYQSGTTVELLYPGTAVNPDGSIADVPGWILQPDGFWVEDPSDAFLREGIDLTYEVNPTATARITYPPASAGCNTPTRPPGAPPAAPPGVPPTQQLPPTGNSPWTATLAASVLGLGSALVLVARRRRIH